MPNVTAPQTHEISLSDGVRKYGIILANGPRSIQETSVVGSTLVLNSQGGKYGDYDPSMAHLEQSDWSAGRGNEDFVNDNTRFFDSKNAWTMQENRVFPALQWKFSGGYRSQDMNQPGSVLWRPLYGDKAYLSTSFVASATYSADKAYIWVKKTGIPGPITLELRTDNAGTPSATVLKSIIVTETAADPTVRILKFDWTTTQALTATTTYHIVVYGSSGTHNTANHWQIGCDATLTGTYRYGTNGSSWTAGTGALYYRVTDADKNRTWKGIQIGTTFYLVDNKNDGGATPSQFYVVNTPTAITEITTTGLTAVTDVIYNGTTYFAQGESTNIRKWNGTTWADDGTNRATYLWAFNDPTAGPVVWRANVTAATVSRANLAAYAATMSFGTAINVGDAAFPITGITDYNNQIWVGKRDSLWTISNDRPSKYNIGMGATPSANNGFSMIASNNFLYVSYLHSLERIYGSTVDDIGAWKGAGMPQGRSFAVVDMESLLSWIVIAGQSTSSATSCVMVYDGRGYHEILRGFETARPIRMVKWQSISGAGGRLWVEAGGDLMYCDFPADTFYPLRDNAVRYEPEAIVVTSTFDMGAKNMPKAWREIQIVSENLSNDTYISVDYQADEEIGTDTWNELGTVYTSPNGFLPINVSNKYRMRFRLRMNTSDNSIPPVLVATVVKCFGRVPTRYQWVIRAKVSDLQTTKTGAPDHDPDEILEWLKEKSQEASILTMECKTLPALDKKAVIVEPPTPWRNFMSTVLNLWGGEIVITLREL